MGLGAPPVTHNVIWVLYDGGQSNAVPKDTLPKWEQEVGQHHICVPLAKGKNSLKLHHGTQNPHLQQAAQRQTPQGLAPLVLPFNPAASRCHPR